MKLHVVASIALALVVGLLPEDAQAQTTISEPPEKPASGEEETPTAGTPSAAIVDTEPVWYGDQLLFVHVASLTGCILGNRVGKYELCYPLGFTFFFGGFAVHGAHGYWDKALKSLGMSVALPIGGALFGYMLDDKDAHFDGAAGLVLGFALSSLVTPIYDIWWQSYHPLDLSVSLFAPVTEGPPTHGLTLTLTFE